MIAMRLGLTGLLAIATGCPGCSFVDGGSDSGLATLLVISDSGGQGAFDPAPERLPDGGTWMSYTVVEPSRFVQTNRFSTHIAHSTDDGLTWVDDGVVNQATEVALSVPGLPVDGGVWVHEVSRLRYDPWAVPAERWVLLWHHYLTLAPPIPEADRRRFDHGWIGLRTADAPLPGRWSAERKLFTAATYLSSDDAIVGPPEVRLGQLHSELGSCAAVSEPGVLVRAEGLYVSLTCAGSAGKIVLLKRDRATGAWAYLGGVLTDVQASAQGLTRWSASELAESGGQIWLIVSPERGILYKGCEVYGVVSLVPPAIAETPILTIELGLGGMGFGGACGWSSGMRSGLLYSERFTAAPEFRMFATRRSPP